MTEQMSDGNIIELEQIREYNLNIGQKFNDYEQLSSCVKAFCREYHHPFIIRSRWQKQVVYKCSHGVKQNSKSNGKRPNQHYYYNGCPAQINFYRGKNEKWTLTKMLLNHNHKIGKEEYAFYGKAKKMNENDYDTATDLLLSSAKDGMIASVLNRKSGKKFIRKDIQNFRNKLFPTITETDQGDLMKFLEEIQENGGVYSIKTDDEEEVASIFLASSEMILNYNNSQCPVIQIDVSFGFNVQNYKLLGFCYYSCITDKSEFAAIAFIARETYLTFINCMNEFKNICKINPSVFLIDKDFTEIKSIREIFSSSTILLCKFHVIKYVKQLISTAYNCQINEKREILNKFKKCLYSKSYEEYEEHKKEFLEICKPIQVIIGTKDKYVSLEEQFIKNWDSCKEMWVHYFRKHLPLMGDTTTNRIERSFWTLKQHIQTKYHSLPTIYLCIKEIINFIDSRINNKLAKNKQKVLKIMDNDIEIRNVLEGCSEALTETGMKLFHRQLKLFKTLESKMKIVDNGIEEKFDNEISKLYNTSVETCSCSFWNSFNAPCRHILTMRKHNDLDIFAEACFHARYLISTENSPSTDTNDAAGNLKNDDNIEVRIEDEIFTDNFDRPNKILSDREKFNMALETTKNIADILSNYGSQTFLKYMEELKTIERNARNGISLFEHGPNELRANQPEEPVEKIQSNNDGSCSNKENLKFKSKIKSKGRPKKKTKQTTFYKKNK